MTPWPTLVCFFCNLRETLRRFVANPDDSEVADCLRERGSFVCRHVAEHRRMKDDQSGIARCLCDERGKFGTQISLDHAWWILPSNLQSGAKKAKAVFFVRPHECFEPGDLVSVVHINRVEI